MNSNNNIILYLNRKEYDTWTMLMTNLHLKKNQLCFFNCQFFIKQITRCSTICSSQYDEQIVEQLNKCRQASFIKWNYAEIYTAFWMIKQLINHQSGGHAESETLRQNETWRLIVLWILQAQSSCHQTMLLSWLRLNCDLNGNIDRQLTRRLVKRRPGLF